MKIKTITFRIYLLPFIALLSFCDGIVHSLILICKFLKTGEWEEGED